VSGPEQLDLADGGAIAAVMPPVQAKAQEDADVSAAFGAERLGFPAGVRVSAASQSTLSSMASQTAGKFIASHSRPAAASCGARAVSRAIRSWCQGAGMALTGAMAAGSGDCSRVGAA
jgi:hypothetical protein